MNPYLEAHWADVHARMIVYLCEQLQERLPDDLRARVEERVYIDSEASLRAIAPDVRVVRRPTGAGSAPPGGGPAIAEPVILQLDAEPVTETFIEVREAGSGDRVISVIEALSPTNKRPGEGRGLYRRKVEELLHAGVNLVEIDLLRGGEGPQEIPESLLPESHRTPYRVLVRRGASPMRVELFRAPLQEPLPVVPVPLRAQDDDAPLELQAALDRAYRTGRYDDLNYAAEPIPPLSGAEAAWADRLRRDKQLR